MKGINYNYWIGLIFLLLFIQPDLLSAQENLGNFPASSSGDIYGQIKVADITGDGKLEMIFGSVDGMIHVFNSEGQEVRQGMWPFQTGGPILTSVQVGDINQDGKINVIAGSWDSNLYCLSNQGGVLWKRNMEGPVTFSNPQLVDFSGNGNMEILAASTRGIVRSYTADGNLFWNRNLRFPISASPLVTDLDNSGNFDVIVKTDEGNLFALDNGGMIKSSAWPVTSGQPNNSLWPFEINTFDFDGDGNNTIVSPTPHPFKIDMIDHSGGIQASLSIPGAVVGAPSMFDLDFDGRQDLILAYNTVNEGAFISVLDENNQPLEGYPRNVGDLIRYPPIIMDVTGDGQLEMIYTVNTDEPGIRGGSLNIVRVKDGTRVSGFPKYIGRTYSRPTICDLTGDGNLEVLVAGGISDTGPHLNVFKLPARLPVKFVKIGERFTVVR